MGSDDGRLLAAYIGGAALTGLLFTLASIVALPGWVGAALGVGQGLAWCAALLYRHRRPWHARVIAFGLVAGTVELVADAWLVGTGTLVYPAGPQLVASPAYMPAAWLGMLSAPIALGVVLRSRLSLSASSALAALAMGLYIPIYELFAHRAAWWWYQGVPLLGGAVPAYIVLGEVLLTLPIVAITERLTRAGWTETVGLGVAQGLWIWAAYALAFRLTVP